nr:hypothetical protein [Plasmopara viticola lesion associated mononegaambi virus 1]
MSEFISNWAESVSSQAMEETVESLDAIEQELEEASTEGVDLFTSHAEEVTGKIAQYLQETEDAQSVATVHKRKSSEETAKLLEEVSKEDADQQSKLKGKEIGSDQTRAPEFVSLEQPDINRIKSPDHRSFTSQRETADLRSKLEVLEQRFSQMELITDKLLGMHKAINPKLMAHDADIKNMMGSLKEIRDTLIETNKMQNAQYTQLLDHISRLSEFKLTGSSAMNVNSPLAANEILAPVTAPELKESLTQKLQDKTKATLKKVSRASRMAPAY